MISTQNYGLYLTDDNSTRFIDWRKQMNGVEDSNMVKIDAALGEKADKTELSNHDTDASSHSNIREMISQLSHDVSVRLDSHVQDIEHGGTNATTAKEARANLGAVGMYTNSIVLSAGTWWQNEDGLYVYDDCDGSCSGVTPESIVFVSPGTDIESFTFYTKHNVRCFDQGLDFLSFIADTNPNESGDIVINYAVFV